jgi:hypothetical protein
MLQVAATKEKRGMHQATKDRTPFFSPKAQKAKERGMEKAKESQAKAKVFGRAKPAKENNLKA